MTTPDPSGLRDRPGAPRERAEADAAWDDLIATEPGAPPCAGPGALRDAADAGQAAGVLDRFAEALAEIGPIEPAELDALLSRFGPGARPEAGVALARELVRNGRLTAYQADAVLRGEARGLVVGPYVVLDRAAAGPDRLVFRARHCRTCGSVALEVRAPAFSGDREALARFRRETAAAKGWAHPHAAGVLDAFEFRGLQVVVHELADGRDPERYVREAGPLPPGRAARLVAQAAGALREAAARGIARRAFSPSEVRIDDSGALRICGLGVTPPGLVDDPSVDDAREDLARLGTLLDVLRAGSDPSPALDAVRSRMGAGPAAGGYPSLDALVRDLDACFADPPDHPAPGHEEGRPPVSFSAGPEGVPAAGRATRPPPSARVTVIAAAVLGLTVAAIAFDGRRAETGELLIQADRADLRVTVKQGDRVVVPPTDRRTFLLPPGEYAVIPEGRVDDLRVTPPVVRVEKRGRARVAVEAVPADLPR